MSSPVSSTEPSLIKHDAQRNPATWEDIRKQNSTLLESPPRPTRTVQCNMMSYTNGEGDTKKIWIPMGTLYTACQHLEKKDWDALARFPAWENQKYADAGEAEERERKDWEWLVADTPEEPKKAA